MNNFRRSLFFPLLIIISGCAGGPHSLSHQHQPSDSKIPQQAITFADYLTATHQHIASHNVLQRSEQQIHVIAPFEMKSNDFTNCRPDEKVGLLMIHGLTDTPFMMRDLAQSIINNNRCVLARSIVLPGHATVPGDLLEVRYEDWINATRYGVKSLDDTGITQLFIAGFSTGGALALNHAMHTPSHQNPKIKGLLLFSPAIHINSRLGFITNWHYLVSWADPKRAWLDILDDKDFAKYESFPKNAADQIHLLTTQNLNPTNSRQVGVPIFVVVSKDDDTVLTNATLDFFEHQTNNKSQLLFYRRDADNNDCHFTPAARACTRSSIYPAMNVISFSHTAIPVARSNTHYGPEGDYKNCYHYLLDKKTVEYKQCMSDDATQFVWGEKSLYPKQSDKPIRRITFNPDFDYMTQLMNRFIHSNR
ncbi:MAG: alpha/beta hydrolase [Gammaproteobacteria bacterium]|nr:alpha/beta hydrolase [Gammaproteobacteria bacterium]